MNNVYDVIVIGAGSVGTPISYSLAKEKFRVLTLDSFPSVGQGSNKTAIGGIRATHSDFAKINLCKRSLEIFSTWKNVYGDDIEWHRGGYVFPVYEESDEINLKNLVEIQKISGLKIEWLTDAEIIKHIPDLNPHHLLGGTLSPDDGSASPLLANHAFYNQAKLLGCHFLFNSPVTGFQFQNGKLIGVKSQERNFFAPYIINAAGAWATKISSLAGIFIPITPDSHEAGITEPVKFFLKPMIVDIRPSENSANFYFYQHITGQVVFCVTPKPNLWGFDIHETSSFLPLAAKRLINILPRLQSIRVRRTWRGLYPMTPDGLPIVGFSREIINFIHAAGMCGQGFMLGPAVGELVARIVTGSLTNTDRKILKLLSPDRKFETVEMLK